MTDPDWRRNLPEALRGALADGIVAAPERGAIEHALEEVSRGAGADVTCDPARLVRVMGASPFLRRFVVRHPDAVEALAAVPPVRGREVWREWLVKRTAGATSASAFGRALRVARQYALLGITARELEAGDPLGTGADLAGLAEAALDITLEAAAGWLESDYGVARRADGELCRPIVIGMGKLGAGELNFSSDIDLIYAYETDDGHSDGRGGLGRRVDLHTYFSRLYARVSEALSMVTDEGFVFRVDLDQRPEGRTGPICNSLDGLESYYESFGHPWERLAWIRARPVAGDLALGAALIERLSPFVYRKHHDFRFSDEVTAMKRRIDARGARLGRKDGFNVKLGRGGIREVEFVVQALQLAWGGKLPELRTHAISTALDRLALAGLLDTGDADNLRGGYVFMRRLEHALQLQEDRQTHFLPADPSARRRAATLLGFAAGEHATTAFEQALAAHRQTIRAAFDSIIAGADPLAADPTRDAAFDIAIDADIERDARLAALADLGFAEDGGAIALIDAMSRRPGGPFHPSELSRGGALARKILEAVTSTVDPDAALAHTERLLRGLRHRRSWLDQLEQDPLRLRSLVGIFGSSHFLSRLLIRSPGLMDRLVFDGSEPPIRGPAALASSLETEPRIDGDWEDVLGAVRHFHQAETLRVGFFDLAGLLDVGGVGRQLSDVADVIVERTLAAASVPAEGDALGIVAFGALGGRELGYGAVLDLIFVAPGELPPSAGRLARQVVTGISCATPEGTLYTLDTRPRPSGNQGPVCIGAGRLRAHYAAEPALWELVRALGARAVSGGDAVVDAVHEIRHAALGARSAAPAGLATQLRAIREARLRASAPGDVRHGRGGIDDVALIVRRAQLSLDGSALEHARDGHACGSAGVAEALTGLVDVDVMAPAQGLALREAYDFLRQLENRFRIVQDNRAGTPVVLTQAAGSPAATDGIRRLARRMGYGEGPGADAIATLRSDLRRHSDVIIDGWTTMVEEFGDD